MQSGTSKRKRGELPVPSLTTTNNNINNNTWPPPLPPLSAPVDRSNTESPRTSMAEHFERLSVDLNVNRTPKTHIEDPVSEDILEIGETPGAYHTLPHHVPSSSLVSPSLAHPHRHILNPPRRVTSPPPPTPIASPVIEGNGAMPVPAAFKAVQEKLSSWSDNGSPASINPPSHFNPPHTDKTPLVLDPNKSLTWQESEITGYQIDMAAEDDGEGINGIGFAPTPAIATERAERRRRQILECRARESREARQHRYDKRKAAPRDSGIAFDEGGDLKRRMVRFEV